MWANSFLIGCVLYRLISIFLLISSSLKLCCCWSPAGGRCYQREQSCCQSAGEARCWTALHCIFLHKTYVCVEKKVAEFWHFNLFLCFTLKVTLNLSKHTHTNMHGHTSGWKGWHDSGFFLSFWNFSRSHFSDSLCSKASRVQIRIQHVYRFRTHIIESNVKPNTSETVSTCQIFQFLLKKI